VTIVTSSCSHTDSYDLGDLGHVRDLNSTDTSVPLLYHDIHWPEEGAVSQEKDLNPPQEMHRAIVEGKIIANQACAAFLPLYSLRFLFQVHFSIFF
jgi:hypothetical protein